MLGLFKAQVVCDYCFHFLQPLMAKITIAVLSSSVPYAPVRKVKITHGTWLLALTTNPHRFLFVINHTPTRVWHEAHSEKNRVHVGSGNILPQAVVLQVGVNEPSV